MLFLTNFSGVCSILLTLLVSQCVAGASSLKPCPLLRAYYPPPTIEKSSDAIKEFGLQFQSIFDDLVRQGYSKDFGAITPNFTSFSVVLFSGGEGSAEDSVFFEYSHTAPKVESSVQVSSKTVFPIGSLTQVFTVYAWLIEMGDGEWETPITRYIPELASLHKSSSSSKGLLVNWEDITIGALTSQMSGIARHCEYISTDFKTLLADELRQRIHVDSINPAIKLVRLSKIQIGEHKIMLNTAPRRVSR